MRAWEMILGRITVFCEGVCEHSDILPQGRGLGKLVFCFSVFKVDHIKGFLLILDMRDYVLVLISLK